MNKIKIIIGSRSSKLALIYAKEVIRELNKISDNIFEIKKIKTLGDQKSNERLSEIGGKGLFSKTIEEELINNKIDIAVHALKDMPTIKTKGLVLNCFLKRNSSNEVLISKNGVRLKDLKPKSVIGTSSFRREYQLKKIRSDLNYKLIRGNIETRIKKLNDGEYDGIILAKAGIVSLGLEDMISEEFDSEKIIPCAGQGTIVVQCRDNDNEIIKILEKINHKETRIRVLSERKVLEVLDGDCNSAVGVFAKIDNFNLEIFAELFSKDGKQIYFIKRSDKINSSLKLASQIGEELISKSNGNYKN